MSNNDPFDARKNGKFSAFSDGPGEPPPFDDTKKEDDLEAPLEEYQMPSKDRFIVSPSLDEMIGKRRLEQDVVIPNTERLQQEH